MNVSLEGQRLGSAPRPITRFEDSSQCNRNTGATGDLGAKCLKARNVSKSVHRLEESVTTKISFPHLSVYHNQEHALGHFALKEEGTTSSHDQKIHKINRIFPQHQQASKSHPTNLKKPRKHIKPSTISPKPITATQHPQNVSPTHPCPQPPHSSIPYTNLPPYHLHQRSQPHSPDHLSHSASSSSALLSSPKQKHHPRAKRPPLPFWSFGVSGKAG